ncbi:hypothetical protein K6T82_05755 [Flavobacterium sp. 17A]|uniref:Lanthionine synthetase C-like protein n=1 Tax=Flavobacterium potami TaxID=2872310 RepID=A0A9X1H8V0_9FLAO|nr:lanthionine synthetase LanC family protein [Flavobacterium potami]MBZ4034262.1 hypothetical protein [Flavobacterium potami]
MRDEILEIEKNIWNSYHTNENFGLYVGLSGIIMFYDYLHAAFGEEEYENKLLTLIEKTNELIEKKINSYSICSGLAGYGLALLRLQNKSVEIEEDYFLTIDSLLIDQFKEHYKSGNFDFMHESMGIAMYFIERYKTTESKLILKILNDFSHYLVSGINGDFFSILMKSSETRNNYYSFGIAHGIASYANFLIYLKKNVSTLDLDITKALKVCVDHLQKNKKYDGISKQFFANVFLIEDKKFIPSRLSWCQGDLGVSNALFNAGVFLEKDDLINDSVLLMNNSSLINFEDSGVRDFGFCHGSAGIAVQFFLAGQKYGLNYEPAINRWLEKIKQQTSNFETFFYYDNSRESYHPEVNLLLGSAGLALTLLTVNKVIDAKWLEVFNLH